ncbi:AAA domain-containing protein [Halobaculum sp. MBLA0143]|uniref:AAA domain-containing protein n=1 Tax=Halobaculum sp. MBLA0143 TaxID=3079933 RepID=UPI003524BF16
MIEELVETWRLADARLFAAEADRERHPETDVVGALEAALDELQVETDDPSGYAVPLFEAETPTPTREYVVYRPDSGQVGWRDTGFGVSGTVRFTDATDHARTVLGRRLRFWLPDERPGVATTVDDDDLPPRRLPPTDSVDPEALFDTVADAVRRARDRERAATRTAYERRAPAERRRGAVGPFALADDVRAPTADGAVRYRYVGDGDGTELRSEGLYADTRCLADGGGDGFPLPVDLTAVEDPYVTLQPDWAAVDGATDRVRRRFADGVRLWLAPVLNPVPFERRLSAVSSVRATPDDRALVAGQRSLTFSANRYDLPDVRVDLDRHQRDALVWADGADDLALIHGPPGTGKTRTLTAVVLAAVQKGQTVLATAHSNQAVDNLLAGESTPASPAPGTLHAAAERDDLQLARIGRNSDHPVVTREYTDASVAAADVVGATTNAAAAFETDRFDLAVVDEATQASRAATLLPLDCAQKLVLAGDHRQLPPYAPGEDGHERLRPSLFETLLERYGRTAATLLGRQYRMHPEIAAFPSEAFYDGRLETAPAARDRTVGDRRPLIGLETDGEERAVGESYANDREATVVVEETQRLLAAGLEAGEIAVVTPYSGQATVVEERLADAGVTGVAVDTVDAFQGGERTAVIVSFVRTDDDGRTGFLTTAGVGPRRLNVALTRARRRLTLVGDFEALATSPPGVTDDASDVYADLAASLRRRGLMESAQG